MFLPKDVMKELDNEALEGRGCIILDLACYFPYSNQEVLTFDFRLDDEDPEPYRLNHRYPNNGYVTVSKKMGRRLSKLGYPFFVHLDRQQSLLLSVIAGIGDDAMEFIIPIHVTLTKDMPVCALSMHFDFDKKEFDFSSNRCVDPKGAWKRKVWLSHGHSPMEREKTEYLGQPDVYTDSNIVVYHDPVKPYPQKIEELALI